MFIQSFKNKRVHIIMFQNRFIRTYHCINNFELHKKLYIIT